MTIKIKRIYEPFIKSDGYRILVDRLWPRGIKTKDAHIDQWMKEVAPSTVLRKWFNHDPEKWIQFIGKYHTELKGSPSFEELISVILKHKVITLVYAAKDEQYNQAVALRQFIRYCGCSDKKARLGWCLASTNRMNSGDCIPQAQNFLSSTLIF